MPLASTNFVGTVPHVKCTSPNHLSIFLLQPAFLLLRLWVGVFGRSSLPKHPFPDIRRAAQHCDSLRLTRVQKTNTVDIHEIHFLQIQSYLWSTTLDLGLHLIKVLGPQLTAQPNPSSALTTNPFNLESHASLVRGTLFRMQRLGHSQFPYVGAALSRRRCSILSKCCSVSKCGGIP